MIHRSKRVAIIGRPNVGKSTLFNILTRTRKAVVKNQPGVTRDILVEPAEWWGETFEVMDTGGITEAKDTFSQLIREQLPQALEACDVLVAVFDAKVGLTPEDRDIIKVAKSSGKPFLMVVNKVDRMHEKEMLTAEFYEFGYDVVACAFETRDNVDSLVEWVIANLPDHEVQKRDGIHLAIVGKPNVGKSSLCNYLLGHQRMLVSDIAGTTVDAVEEGFQYDGQDYVIIDTAGLRRSAKRREDVEILSAYKSRDSIAKADIVFLMVDVTVGPTDQDARIMQEIIEQHKAVILVANKSDLGKEMDEEFKMNFRQRVLDEFHFFVDVPVMFISAKSGKGVKNLFDKTQDIWEKLNQRISTSKLNNFFFEVIRGAPAPVWGHTDVKFYYLTQTNQRPPSFIAFANHPDGVTPSYRRFLSKRLKEQFGLEGIPVRIFCMKSRKKKRSSKKVEDYKPVDSIDDLELDEHVFEYDLGPEQA